MKLKTLKDIGGTTHVFKSWIKQEAIKWIKELKNPKNWKVPNGLIGKQFLGTDLWEYDYEQDDGEGAILFIKHFFNITREDLKK